jgi:hypothetical protein
VRYQEEEEKRKADMEKQKKFCLKCNHRYCGKEGGLDREPVFEGVYSYFCYSPIYTVIQPNTQYAWSNTVRYECAGGSRVKESRGTSAQCKCNPNNTVNSAQLFYVET